MTDVSTIDPAVVPLLACPIDKGSLIYVVEESVLYNPRLRRAYPIDDGIPVLLAAEGRPVDDDDHTYYLWSS